MKKQKQGSGVPKTNPEQGGQRVEQIPTSDLIPYARNARTHSDEQVAQIAASIREFGFCNPVLIDAENTIIAGHGRVLAASRMKLETVPCIRLSHLTDAQKRAYVIADNRIALSSGWDSELLANELSDLHADDFDMGTLGFDVDELATLLGGGWESDIESVQAAGEHTNGIRKVLSIELAAEVFDAAKVAIASTLTAEGIDYVFR